MTSAPHALEPRNIETASGTGGVLVVLCLLCWIPALWLRGSVLRIQVPDAFDAVLLSPPILLFLGALLVLFLAIRLHARLPGNAIRRQAAQRRASWIPFAISIACMAFPWWPWFTGSVFHLVLPGLLAWNIRVWLSNDHEAWQPPVWMHRGARWIPLCVLGGVTLLHTFTGLYFTSAVGEHAGDEGHYLIQARSLWEDGDLDIRNNFGDPSGIQRAYVHISPNSIGDKWYSWHSPGLSFLLAPTAGAGLWARHLVLGFCSGLALCGLYQLAVLLGARIRHAWLLVCLTAASTFWSVYASRALPEVLGAALAIWGLYGVFMQARHPWTSLLPVCMAIGFLPWVQTRFLPMVPVLWGAYGLQGLLQQHESWRVKLPRLAFFSALSLGLLLVYRFAQLSMFTNGSSYDADGLLFSSPAGLWHILASCRGILYMFPLFAFAFAALLYALVRKKSSSRLPAVYAILLFASVWLSSCATVWFTGGACLPGRFLLVTLLPMLAITAVVLRKAPPAFLFGTLIAGMYSVCIFVAMLSVLPSFGKSFGTPHTLEVIHPFYGMMARFLYDPYTGLAIFPAMAIYLGALLLLALPRRYPILIAVSSALMLLALVLTAGYAEQNAPSPRQHAAMLARFRLHGKYLMLVPWSNPQRVPRPIQEVIDRFHGIAPTETKHITTRDLGVLVDEKWISLPYVETNDWNQRPYRWATIVPPFPAGKGASCYVAISGQLQGSAIAHLAIREGSMTHLEKKLEPGAPVNESIAFESHGRGDVYVLLRFEEGDGQFLNHATHAGIFPRGLLEKGLIQLELPPSSPVP